MTGIYDITLRSPDGQEQRFAAWLPSEGVRQEFYREAHKRGLEIINGHALGSAAFTKQSD